jgi:hypothetical protein
MKTAIQEVFSDLEKLHPNLFNIYTSEGKEFVNHFHKYLEIEKQQIIEAHGDKQKLKSNPGSIVTYGYNFTGEMYYNETFKNTENEKNNN